MSKAGGFITLHRKMLDWEWYKNINTKTLFIHLLLKANYKPANFMGTKIQRGQLATSLTGLSSETGLSVRQVRVSLEHLIMTGEVTSKAYPKYRVITVVKYDEYQDDDKVNDKQMTGNTAGKRQANDKQMTGNTATIEQYNKNNKETKKQTTNTLSASRGRETDTEANFDIFWDAYPRKASKPAARKAFEKLKVSDELLLDMIDAIDRWKQSPQWQENGGQYIPYPASWLNQRKWEDDIPVGRPAAKPAAKPLPVQDFEQRDYSSEQEDWTNRLLDWEKGGSI